jgi:hypothetical protein
MTDLIGGSLRITPKMAANGRHVPVVPMGVVRVRMCQFIDERGWHPVNHSAAFFASMARSVAADRVARRT